MAGTFPGVCNTQQQDVNGRALAGAILSVFIGGGGNVLAQCFQDITLLIPAQNPMTSDLSGRLPLVYVADGTYRVRLTDKTGSTANGGFDYPQVPSIGASSGGGGGTPVDPTTVASTGWVQWQPVDGLLSGWTRMNGRTIGSATSGASERAAADVQAQFIFLWNNFADAICPVVGGRGANALADFNANKQIALFDMRFRAPVGMDTMGNLAAGRSTGATFSSGDASTAASFGGEAGHTLTTPEIPAHLHSITDVTHTHTVPSGAALAATYVGGGGGNASFAAAQVTGASLTGITATNNAGGGGVHNNMAPFATGTFYMKL